jgi:FMN phosphatase YigB (HAD superfamily)
LHGCCKLAVLSNSPSGLATWLATWRILQLFDVVFCSGDERCAKPDPAAFEATLERLGVKPEEAVFIDDTIEHVRVARVLGMHGILFRCADRLVTDVENLTSGHVSERTDRHDDKPQDEDYCCIPETKTTEGDGNVTPYII